VGTASPGTVVASIRRRHIARVEGDNIMLWTILVILAIVVLAIFILNYVRGRGRV
jgi:hypothetical protein